MNNTTTTETKTATSHARAAKTLRSDLKAAFPGVKFSVRSESFAGGNAVRVSWVDGPAYEAVNDIANEYTSGDFDGMTDSYSYRADAPAASVMFVSCNRSISDDLNRRVVAAISDMYSGTSVDIETIAYRILRNADLRRPYAGLVPCDGVWGFEVVTAVATQEAAAE